MESLDTLPRVAVCAIVRDEGDYIEEWINFHRAQGVSEFRIYDNGSKDRTPDILSSLGIQCVTIDDSSKDFGVIQTGSYFEARSTLVDFDWVAYIDIDEFLFGRDGKTLQKALSEFPSDVSAIAVQQRVFGSSFLEKHEPGNVVDRFTMCSLPNYSENFWFKTISRPSKVRGFDTPHSALISGGRYVLADGSDIERAPDQHPGMSPKLAHGSIGLHHYIVKSKEEFLKKSARWEDRRRGPLKKVHNYFDIRLEATNATHCHDLCGLPDHGIGNAG